jgi:hypothetical protein
MSKGDKNRGNREAKKPKKVKVKESVVADFSKGKNQTLIGAKKLK